MHRSSTVYKQNQPKTVLNKADFTLRGQGMDFFIGGSIVDLYLAGSDSVKIKSLNGFVSYKHAAFHIVIL